MLFFLTISFTNNILIKDMSSFEMAMDVFGVRLDWFHMGDRVVVLF